MVADTLDNLARYIGLHPHLDLAIKALDGMVDRKGSMQRPKWGCPLFGGKIARDNESRI